MALSITVENYPYPFVIGNLIWEVPFVYPNDYTGQALHGHQNPITIADFKAGSRCDGGEAGSRLVVLSRGRLDD